MRSHQGIRVLVVYGTTEGHTRDVATRVAETLRVEGVFAKLAEAAEAGELLARGGWDALVLGASVHQGQHQTSVVDFAKVHAEALAKLPTAFFSVCLAAAVDHPEKQREAQGYVAAFLEDTGLKPLVTASFAGALRHARYDYFKRLVLELLNYQLGGNTVTSEDVVYTDWNRVEGFARGFLAQVLAAPHLPLSA
jgi:menaquinone-dependent protoporphyrinogen oxidase